MALSEEKIREYQKRLVLSRMRILCHHGFYGLLLMHMRYAIDEATQTAYTDGERIAFGPSFLEELSDSELDFVMMHEILHMVLQHCFRGVDAEPERYNMAADIVVNSNIMLENGSDPYSITLSRYGECMHTAPNGKEGHLYTAEEVYEMLRLTSSKKIKPISSSGGSGSGSGSRSGAGSGSGSGSGPGSGSDSGSGSGSSLGSSSGSGWATGRAKKVQGKAQNGNSAPGSFDDHSHWGELEEDDVLRDVWVKRLEDACEAMENREASDGRGLLPMFAKRILKELRKPQTDWRTILNDFVQEEIADYSFSPPDRRFDDSPFFLPDFNEKDDMLKDILFMIDTSGSISDDMVIAAYSEVKGALDQFDGRLKGWLGFFDAAIIEPKPFESFDDVKKIKPAGGGGTDFQIIFEYVRLHMSDHPPICIIILTDGGAPFPQEHLANDIPVLWLLNNENVTPPWGKVARISV